MEVVLAKHFKRIFLSEIRWSFDIFSKAVLRGLVEDVIAGVDGWSQCSALLLAHATLPKPECFQDENPGRSVHVGVRAPAGA